ncbi:Sap185p NDAI_0G05440 [Naumovozyma dairenensis CBS 421]|uniref:Uncharacterized protein n=1 Tax=Naumovozyma dairenensis (strain ATCC 10597 / BCRC 20456 / CBS 421 / NBRC 0211 / NRRL Y-12639) TaxID=1071378 RepID=J7RTG5_NAUDC|nr:hypothetical protein NDAI_0G05440 [Naumovozyma dairenensis CBS 421]CCK73527.1 hypothetical protein NDAI_0G05440 [Naumovozyma dairenensis CBS 421]
MSGSFWKFGQDYSNESSISKILDRAFIKIEKPLKKESSDTLDDTNNDEEKLEADESLPNSEAGFKNYKPNLEILDELLDDEELYTELMCSNFKLLIYIKYPEVLLRLLDYVKFDEHVKDEENPSDNGDSESDDDNESDGFPKEEESDDRNDSDGTVSEVSEDNSVTLPVVMEEQVEVQRAHVAAEVLSAEVWAISSAIMEQEEFLEKLWSIMDHSVPLSIETSTYFMKINERLLDMDITGMVSFILGQENLVDRFLNHIDNPPLLDFLLKVISSDKPDAPTGVIECVKSQNLIPRLIDCLSNEHDASIQTAAADFLKAFVTISGNCNNEIASGIGPNELTRQLVSRDIMEKLINNMLDGGTALSNSVGIIIELIRKNNSDYDFVQVLYTTLETHPPSDKDPIYLGPLITLFAEYMPKFTKLLRDTNSTMLRTSFGNIEPLGFERFKVCELIAELLHCSNMSLLNELKAESIINERDAERVRLLSLAKDSEGTTPVNNNDIDIEDISVTEKLNSLDLKTDDNDEVSSAADGSVTKVASEEGDTDVEVLEGDVIDDSEELEKQIRDYPTPGDLLKMSLYDTKIVTDILNMFFSFPWNNFLHNVVFDIIQQIFNGPLKTGYNVFLLKDLLVNIKISKLIIEGDKKSSLYEEKTDFRLGYMGHLTLIGEEILKLAAYIEETKISFSNTDIMDALNNTEWINYADTTLADTREKYETPLGECVDEILGFENQEGEDGTSFDSVEISPELLGNDVEEYYTENNGDDEDYNIEFNNSSMLNSFHQSSEFGDDDDEDDEREVVGYDDEDPGNYDPYNDDTGTRYYEYTDPDGTTTKLNFSLNNIEHEPSDFTKMKPYGTKLDDHANKKDKRDKSGQSVAKPFSWKNIRTQAVPAEPEIHDEDIFQHQFEHDCLNDDDNDAYLDPNDDGQSYSKLNNPLYSDMMDLHSLQRTKGLYYSRSLPLDDSEPEEETIDEEEAEEDNFSDDSDFGLEDDLGNDIYGNGKDDGNDIYSLCRTTSKDNLSWDEDEQERLEGMVNYTNRWKDHSN